MYGGGGRFNHENGIFIHEKMCFNLSYNLNNTRVIMGALLASEIYLSNYVTFHR